MDHLSFFCLVFVMPLCASVFLLFFFFFFFFWLVVTCCVRADLLALVFGV